MTYDLKNLGEIVEESENYFALIGSEADIKLLWHSSRIVGFASHMEISSSCMARFV